MFLTARAASLWPGGLALTDGPLAWTHAELEARVADAAARLAGLGLGEGDVVGLWGANSPDWVVALHAVTRLGAVAQLVNHRAAPAEAEDLLARGDARHVLADREVEGRPFTRLADLGSLPSGPAPAVAPDTARPFVRVATSGTSGKPKLVTLKGGHLLASAAAVAQALALGPADRWWCAMPTAHVGGLGILLRSALTGAGIVLAGKGPFSASPGITLASCVPTMLRDALAAGPLPAELRALMLGGAAIPPDLVAACPIALASYGLSEAASTVTLVRPGAEAHERGTCGPALPGTRLRVLDEAGQVVAPGVVGRLQVQGPTVMDGYYRNPEASARALREGWLETGDFGALDERGLLTVAARREDLIISGGENVYPAEVEAVLREHPAIADVAVTAAPHERWGQVPMAVVVWREGPVELREWLAPRLARFKQPHACLEVERLPLTATGKPDRAALAALVMERSGR